MADIFNAPSDDEEFIGFRDDVPMETLSSEESCDSFDSLESGKQVWVPPLKTGMFLESWILAGLEHQVNGRAFYSCYAFVFQETAESTWLSFAV